ncbi:MAG: hypothetical protein U9Q70_08520 [Chloroflexota bacterium]|nr:hypothetical protein [Chloroflexota bacterium]
MIRVEVIRRRLQHLEVSSQHLGVAATPFCHSEPVRRALRGVRPRGISQRRCTTLVGRSRFLAGASLTLRWLGMTTRLLTVPV